MPPEDDIPERVNALEREVGRMRDELMVVRTDAAAARVLAAGADHDVSEVRAELRAHTRSINALREDQVDLRRHIDRGFAQVDREFATVHAGLRQIVGLIDGITPE